ncbi:MAG: hypothetical protein V3T83_06425 [Acidobacteriota bacterium]
MNRFKETQLKSRFVVVWLATLAVLVAGAPAAGAQPGSDTCIQFDTELVQLNLTGGPFPIPLASDPDNDLGDSIDGYGFVDSQVDITLSSQRAPAGPASSGLACAAPASGAGDRICIPRIGCPDLTPFEPLEFEGQPFVVDSFFDVFFDITVTDVDPRAGRDYAGQSDGASFSLPDNGPAGLASRYVEIFQPEASNFGLIPPPEADPYIGHFLIEIPLGADINGNGENDKIKFTLASHSVGGTNRQFIVLPDGTILDQFDSAAFMAGAIVDESDDPPFEIGAKLPNGLPDPAAFGGPATASSSVANPLPDADGDGVTDSLDQCPDSDLSATVSIGGCDSGVGNALVSPGCTISDLILGIAAGARNHGAFVSGVAHLLEGLRNQGAISASERGRIQRCAARSRIGRR